MGLLDTPQNAVVRKVAVLGKAASGKTTLINCLAKRPVQEKYSETLGMQVTSVEGPVVYDASGTERGISEYRFWEVGSRYEAQFNYMIPEALKDCAAAIIVFSFSDKPSFMQVPALLDQTQGLPRIVVGTKADDPTAWAVTAAAKSIFSTLPALMTNCYSISSNQSSQGQLCSF